jgi:hypothetical protein
MGAASHCGLFVFDRMGSDLRDANIRAQFSLAGEATEFNTDPATIRDDREAFLSGRGYYRVDPPWWMSQSEFETAVISDAEAYRAGRYAPWEGPNSNSAAGYPLIINGATLPAVNEGWLYGPRNLDYWYGRLTPPY